MAGDHDAGPTEGGARAKASPTGFGHRASLLASIGTGGAIGAAARYGTALAVPTHSGGFPLATFLVNVVGGAILGAVGALPADWVSGHQLTQQAIGAGFCGGLTTFSTMTLEIYQRLPGYTAVALGYAAISLLAAPACAWAGFALVRTARNALRERRAPPGDAGERTR